MGTSGFSIEYCKQFPSCYTIDAYKHLSQLGFVPPPLSPLPPLPLNSLVCVCGRVFSVPLEWRPFNIQCTCQANMTTLSYQITSELILLSRNRCVLYCHGFCCRVQCPELLSLNSLSLDHCYESTPDSYGFLETLLATLFGSVQRGCPLFRTQLLANKINVLCRGLSLSVYAVCPL